MRQPWIQKRLRWLKDYARTSDKTNAEITRIYNEKFNENRSVKSVAYQLWNVKHSRIYTDEQVTWLKRQVNAKPSVVTALFNNKFNENRSVQSVRMKLYYIRCEIQSVYGDSVADVTDRGNSTNYGTKSI